MAAPRKSRKKNLFGFGQKKETYHGHVSKSAKGKKVATRAGTLGPSISTFEASNIVKSIAADQGYNDERRNYERNLSSDEVQEYISGHPLSRAITEKLGKTRIRSIYVHEYKQGAKRYAAEKKKVQVTKDREEKKAAPKSAGSFRGVELLKLPDGDFTTSIDRDSHFDSIKDAKDFITDRKSNPKKRAINPREFRVVTANGDVLGKYADKEKAESYAKRVKQSSGIATTIEARIKNGTDDWKRVRSNPKPKKRRPTRRKNVILPGSVTDALTSGATRLVKGSKTLASKATRAVKKAAKRNPTAFAKKAAKRNPLKKLDDKMKKLGARVTKTGFGRRKYVMPKKRRSNPEAAAERAYKEFTGYDPDVVMDLVEEEHVHAVMVNRGKLIAWEILNANGKAFTLPMPGWEERKDRGKPYWHFDESMAATDIVWLASSEDGRQLYTKGGDQELDIESLGLEAIDERDHMFIGTIVKAWYAQKKKFEGPDECHFHHEFGKEGSKGVLPLLLYNPRSAKMKIAGGRYQIAEPEGALDGVSPGIIG